MLSAVINNPFAYSAADLILIENVRNDNGGYTAAMWFDPRLEELKGRIKQHYLLEQDNRCCYCNQQIGINHGRAWDTEHVIARSIQPNFVMEPRNLAVSCIECDTTKSDNITTTSRARQRYPNTSDFYLICHPHFDNIHDHIDIFQQYVYVSKSIKGRKTIELCGIARYYERFGMHLDLDDGDIDHLMESCLLEPNQDRKRIRVLEAIIAMQHAFVWRRRR